MRKYAGLGLSELRELRQLREENGKLVAPTAPDASVSFKGHPRIGVTGLRNIVRGDLTRQRELKRCT